jgi:hypothetical protein
MPRPYRRESNPDSWASRSRPSVVKTNTRTSVHYRTSVSAAHLAPLRTAETMTCRLDGQSPTRHNPPQSGTRSSPLTSCEPEPPHDFAQQSAIGAILQNCMCSALCCWCCNRVALWLLQTAGIRRGIATEKPSGHYMYRLWSLCVPPV